MNRSITLILTFLMKSILAAGQLKITGHIQDTAGTPLLYSTLKLRTDTLVVQTVLSDSTGYFSFTDLAPGIYGIEGSYIGNKALLPPFRLNRDTIVSLIIRQSGALLKTVEVTGSKPLLEKKIDRLIFNVENSIAAKGTDLTEAIALTPRLRISQSGISIVGKSGVAVMINDRILPLSGTDLLNYLKSLRSDDVASIEVITTPPARYDAQGNSGLINIILKKNPSLGWSGTISTAYSQATYAAVTNNVNLNYQSKKLSSSLKLRQYDRASRITEELDAIGINSARGNDIRKDMSDGIGLNLSMDYKLSKKSSAGFIYDIGKSNANAYIDNHTTYQTHDRTDSILTTLSDNRNPVLTQTLNLYSDHRLDNKGKKLSTAFNYFSTTPETAISFLTSSDKQPVTAVVNSYSDVKYHIWSAQADLTLPYPVAEIETGAKVTGFSNDADISYYNLAGKDFIIDPSRSNIFYCNEKNLAGYFSARRDFGRKWSAKAGLRYEYAIVTGFSPTTDTRNRTAYGRFFPTAYLSYKPNTRHSWGLTYSKRINRPYFRALNPARWYSNPYTYYVGAPLLQPSYSHNIELSWLYKGILSVSLFGDKVLDGFGFIGEMDGTLRVYSPKNYLTQYNAGIVITLNKKFFPWWETNSYLTFSYADSKSAVADAVTQNGSGFSYSTNNTFPVSRKVSLFVNFTHSLPSTKGYLYNAGQYMLSSGGRTTLLQNRLQLSASVNDILRSAISRGQLYYKDFTQYNNTYYDSRRLNVSITYLFGKTKVRGNQKQINFKETQRAN
ncbi:TonB-dependent receptor [Chitinophaga sp. Mgbs1]|uniref:TonB-dependent receptor n=1 Tax=Chitinophaga solisilvae TaxID=1233460 RepID=A0A433WJ51_9BACT|nr:TonB-dependent receptor [Chitinophaga solisilvae]